jgi:hypothetical protein
MNHGSEYMCDGDPHDENHYGNIKRAIEILFGYESAYDIPQDE